MGFSHRGGIIGRAVRLVRTVAGLKIRLHAASCCYFLVLAVFPALLLLLGLVQLTHLEVERLGEMFAGVIPEAFLEGAEELILLTYDRLSASAIGLSAVTTLWPASRGIYGLACSSPDNLLSNFLLSFKLSQSLSMMDTYHHIQFHKLHHLLLHYP